MRQELIETMASTVEVLEEATAQNNGQMKVHLVWGSADEINGNGRVYPEVVQDREIEKFKGLIEDKAAYSEADHPPDGKSRIRNTAAIPISVKKIKVGNRKLYVGEALILSTSLGKDLQEIIKAGGRIGISQRGSGSLVKGKWDGKEVDIVQEDYSLKTFDFVLGQSVKGAEITELTEQQNKVFTRDQHFQRRIAGLE